MAVIRIFNKMYDVDNTGKLSLTFKEYRELCKNPDYLKMVPVSRIKKITGFTMLVTLNNMGLTQIKEIEVKDEPYNV